MSPRLVDKVWLLVLALAIAGCRDGESPAPAPEAPSTPALDSSGAEVGEPAEPDDPVALLRAFEEERRKATDFAQLAPSDRLTGPNPFDVAVVPAGAESSASADRFVGILRGADAVVLLDERGKELHRLAAPSSPTGLAVVGPAGSSRSRDGVYVSGEGSSKIARYRVTTDTLERVGDVEIPGALAITDIAYGREGVLYAIEEFDGRLLALDLVTRRVHESARCLGPMRVAREAGLVLIDCLLERAVLIYRVTRRGIPKSEPFARIQHDGPIWSMAAQGIPSGLLVAVGGVEDRALDRSDGSFGYVDSFVTVYHLDGAGGAVRRLASVNVAEHGLVTPKWLDIELTGGSAGGQAMAVEVAGYGSGRRLVLSWAARQLSGDLGEPRIAASDLPPGTSALARGTNGFLAANPLLDAWVASGDNGAAAATIVRVAGENRLSVQSRVGEALFFTTLMAPWNPSEGRASRFTCETCHFEAYGDGRTHYTGRKREGKKVHATTKPLRGLFNNRPHFSRALDRTMAKMVHNEFKVANRGSGRDPWFALDTASFPWLREMGDMPERLSPLYLRKALMSFLMQLTHRGNPAIAGKAVFDDVERAGAAVFRDRCESCHSARLIADGPESRIPFERWQSLILAPEGAIVWGRAEYVKTGVEPYVHDDGARVPSLRRLYKKRPYFTNGTAPDLRAVLERARFGTDRKTGETVFFHDGAPAGLSRLGAGEIRSLSSFLRLL